jgi:hypothetical protein
MAKMKQFMQPQILKGKWIAVETDDGTFFLPEDVGIPVWWEGEISMDSIYASNAEESEFRSLVLFYEQFMPGRNPGSFEVIKGFGARLSAPGYLDSTDWCVFDTVEEATAYIQELTQ